MGKIAAFFDIDGTLYRDSLMVEHFKKLVTFDIIDEKSWYDGARDTYMNWDKRQGNYDDYLSDISDLYIKSLTGLDKTCIDFTSDQVIRLKSERVYKYTRSRIKWHLDNGHIVIFISGSPSFLVERMAKKYNVTDFAGSEYVLEDGIFNVKVIPMWDSRSKNNAINDFVKIYDLDLSRSYAYGDTNGDISMLRRVKNPIAINPTKELLTHLANDSELSKNTKVIIERKDIIYCVNPNVDILDI
jgi:HAD superfamily hydrolase (TIGR01490 family)